MIRQSSCFPDLWQGREKGRAGGTGIPSAPSQNIFPLQKGLIMSLSTSSPSDKSNPPSPQFVLNPAELEDRVNRYLEGIKEANLDHHSRFQAQVWGFFDALRCFDHWYDSEQIRSYEKSLQAALNRRFDELTSKPASSNPNH